MSWWKWDIIFGEKKLKDQIDEFDYRMTEPDDENERDDLSILPLIIIGILSVLTVLFLGGMMVS